MSKVVRAGTRYRLTVASLPRHARYLRQMGLMDRLAGDSALRGLDSFGHGTHIAGIMTGNDPSSGFAGVAQSSRTAATSASSHPATPATAPPPSWPYPPLRCGPCLPNGPCGRSVRT